MAQKNRPKPAFLECQETDRILNTVAVSKWQIAGIPGMTANTGSGPATVSRGWQLNTLRHEGGKWLIIDSQNTDIIEGVVSRPQ